MSVSSGETLSEVWGRDLAAVFAAAFTTLALELLLSRFAAFYLSNDGDLLAIPLTLLGLGAGSLHAELRPAPRFELARELLAIALAIGASLVAVFFLFSTVFALQRDLASADPALFMGRTLAFCAVTTPPFYFCGRLLGAVFRARGERIGLLYGADLAGAALACIAVPLILHACGLELVVVALFVVQAVACAITAHRAIAAIRVLGAAAAVVLALGFFEGRIDPSGLVRRPSGDERATQLAYRWNAYSRVSLVDQVSRGAHRFRIIHDNAESNVWPGEYRPDRSVLPFERDFITYLPFVMPHHDRTALVMFAGVGLQMMELDRFAQGRLAIDGVELNPTVVEIGTRHPALEHFGVQAFLDQPHIELYVEEGRQFLARTARVYDVIYVASDAATKRAKVGHSRKYLDTQEAMAAYLAHLADDGLLIFQSKPYVPKIEPLRAAFADAGLKSFADAIVILSADAYGEANDQHHIVVKKGAFAPSEVQQILEHYRGLNVFYAPFAEVGVPEVRAFVTEGDASLQPRTYALHPTDDRPHHLRVDFGGYDAIPTPECRATNTCFASWMKVSTLAIVSLVPGVLLSLLWVGKRARMPPAPVFAFLAATGAAYMLVQIAFIGKLELLFASPLVSMSILFAAFLASNAAGSVLVDRWPGLTPLRAVPVAVLCTAAGLAACEAALGAGSGAPWVLRVALTLLAVLPAGVALGLFFPLAVRTLRAAGHADRIPISYAVSVFASVAGAAYAMIMMMNLGYAALVYQALGLYGLAAIPAALLGRSRFRVG